MPHVTIYDRDGEKYEADVDYGIDLIDACEEAGITLPHSCGRGGWCSTCAVTIKQGEVGDGKDLSPPMGPEELETMEKANLDTKTQVLSCSCQVFGDVTVQEAGGIDVQ